MMSFKKAAVLAFVAVYGPFLLMAHYMLAFVACSHCKAAAWKMLPVGPALVLSFVMRDVLPIGQLDGGVTYFVAIVVSLATIGLLVLSRRLGRRWMVAAMAIVMLFNCYQALVLMALIRA